MLEATRILATATKYVNQQLEGIAREFGDEWPMECIIPVGALIHARREYENFKHPQDAVTSCARVVAAAEAFLVLTGQVVGAIEPGMYVDLPREVNGPGPVPILGVEYVQFADGALPAITIAHKHIEDAPLMEFCDLEGRLLAVSVGHR